MDACPLYPMGGLRPHACGLVELPGQKGGSVELYYELYGNPSCLRSLVIINGGLSKIPALGHVLQEWVRQPFKILVYESRGIGRSSCPPGPQTTKLLAADCLAVVNEVLGAGADFYLVGASLGGMVAQELLYALVAAGQQSRVLGAYLLVTSGGSWLRLPPPLRYPLLRASLVAQVMYRDQADFERKFAAVNMDFLFSRTWLDGRPGAEATTRATQTAVAAAVGPGSGSDQPTAAGAAGGVPPTRRELVRRIYSAHWRELLAGDVGTEAVAATWQSTALLSHYLQPARAAAIRASGIPIGVGMSSHDSLFPARQQWALAAALGARRTDVLCAGHMDCGMLDGADPRRVVAFFGCGGS